MDYLDDTTRIDTLFDEDAGTSESGYFTVQQEAQSSPPVSEPLFLSDSDDGILEVPNPIPEIKRHSISPEVERPTKRRKLASPQTQPEPRSDNKDPEGSGKETLGGAHYIGEFLVDGAYSLVSGTKAIKPGERVFISRSSKIDTSGSKELPSKPQEKGKGKQTTLAGFVTKTVKPPKGSKKVDNIVRFISERGSQLGRLPVSTAEFIGICLDLQLAVFSGVVIEAPERIRIGDSLLLSIRAYLNPIAFQKPSTIEDEERVQIFNEGTETGTEKMLRERKASLLKLFDKVGLRPRISAPVIKPEVLGSRDLNPKSRQATAGKTRRVITEIVGEGDDMEEIEVEGDDEEVLDENELDVIYKKAQMHDIGMQEMEPVDTFAMQLRPYQKQALRWMKAMEEGEKDARNSRSMHPLWQEFAFPVEPLDTGVIDLCEDERPFYFNPYSGELSLEFPQSTTNSKGGILADVGMGKTIQIASLIHSVKQVEENGGSASSQPVFKKLVIDRSFNARLVSKRRNGSSATLVIAPTSLLSQWASELGRASKKGSLRIMVWHGTNRSTLEAGLDNIDVLITSYGVLASEHARHEGSKNTYRSPLFETTWFRIVIDEAHHIKSRFSKTAKAAYALQGQRKWALTGNYVNGEITSVLLLLGTPIVNRLEDLQSLLHFLDFKPWSDYPFFRSFISSSVFTFEYRI
ncbi:DNA helicase rad5 [Serendipita sp. 396]|nr:DNA helicase rad5 [Serendipita sp. 396]